jgi:predicted enzyme related to lactoylglutathione lyase
MILKTYARWFTHDVDAALPALESIVGRQAEYRFAFGDLEIAGIGDFCVVAGCAEALAPYTGTVGPVVVDDLDATQALVLAAGASISRDEETSTTGRFFYARHPDGVEVEYLQWNPETVQKVFGTR